MTDRHFRLNFSGSVLGGRVVALGFWDRAFRVVCSWAATGVYLYVNRRTEALPA